VLHFYFYVTAWNQPRVCSSLCRVPGLATALALGTVNSQYFNIELIPIPPQCEVGYVFYSVLGLYSTVKP
jgi:hypothetical protein